MHTDYHHKTQHYKQTSLINKPSNLQGQLSHPSSSAKLPSKLIYQTPILAHLPSNHLITPNCKDRTFHQASNLQHSQRQSKSGAASPKKLQTIWRRLHKRRMLQHQSPIVIVRRNQPTFATDCSAHRPHYKLTPHFQATQHVSHQFLTKPIPQAPQQHPISIPTQPTQHSTQHPKCLQLLFSRMQHHQMQQQLSHHPSSLH